MRAPAKLFDLKGVLPFQIALENIACHGGDDFWGKTSGIDFASAGDAARCCQGDKNKIAPPKAGRWVLHNIAGLRCKLHDGSFLANGPRSLSPFVSDSVTPCKLGAQYHEKTSIICDKLL